MESMAVIRQGSKDASRVEEILRLPDSAWSNIKVNFGLDEFATADVTFLLTGEQLIDLAKLAHKRIADNCMVSGSDMPDEDHLEDALLNEARASVALDGETRS